MTTGYTEKIKDGINFREFALGCAKAFGPLIHMRDMANDAEIPQVINPSPYHADRLKEAIVRFEKLTSMSDEEIFVKTSVFNKKELSAYSMGIKNRADLKGKYLDMLACVEAWEAPSAEYNGYKKFMIEQIESSIDYDCSNQYSKKPETLSTEEWKAAELVLAKNNIEYHTEENDKAIKSAEFSTRGVKQLFKSLPEED